MRFESVEKTLCFREMRRSLKDVIGPELQGLQARDAANIIDRILKMLILDEEVVGKANAELDASLGRAGSVADANLLEVALEHEMFLNLDQNLIEMGGDDTVSTDAAPADSKFTVTAEQVANYLRNSNLPAYRDAAVRSLSLIPGGRSKETILVTLDGMPEKSHELILRKDRRIALISGKASDEYDVLKAVWDYGGVPCPRPILGEADENALGGTFLLMERVHGLRGGEYFPDLESPRAHRREIVLHFARSMAHLHAMPLELLEHTKVGKASPQPPTVDSIRADIQSFENRIEAFGYRASATLSRAFSWMYDHIDFALIDVEPRIIQGDVGLHNMIIDGPKVAALVDWELARIGSASSELGSAWHMVTALASWPEFAAEYIKHGGPPLSVDQRPVLFWRLFKAIWALCVCRDMCAMFRSGARRDIVAAGSALDSHFRHQRNVTLAVWDACNLELAN